MDDGTDKNMNACTELYQQASMINPAVLRLRVWPLIWGGGGIMKKMYFSLFPLQKEGSESNHNLLSPAVKTEPPTEKANKFASLLWKWITKRISC